MEEILAIAFITIVGLLIIVSWVVYFFSKDRRIPYTSVDYLRQEIEIGDVFLWRYEEREDPFKVFDITNSDCWSWIVIIDDLKLNKNGEWWVKYHSYYSHIHEKNFVTGDLEEFLAFYKKDNNIKKQLNL